MWIFACKADITIVEEDGATFAAQAESFDVIACLGGSLDYRCALHAFARWTTPAAWFLWPSRSARPICFRVPSVLLSTYEGGRAGDWS